MFNYFRELMCVLSDICYTLNRIEYLLTQAAREDRNGLIYLCDRQFDNNPRPKIKPEEAK